MNDIAAILENMVTDSKRRADEARATTVKLCELNAMMIYEQSAERADAKKKASDAILESILEKVRGK